MDGFYQANIETPMGMIQGKLELRVTQNNKIEGNLQAMGMSGVFQGELLEENKCNFSGNLNTILGSIQYRVIGVLEGKQLNIIATTNKGEFKIVANKIS